MTGYLLDVVFIIIGCGGLISLALVILLSKCVIGNRLSIDNAIPEILLVLGYAGGGQVFIGSS